MDKKLNTHYTFTFCDGSTCEMTLQFYALYQLKSRNKALYEKYNRIINVAGKGDADELEMITLLYIAYLCDLPAEETPMSEEEFLIKCGSDRMEVGKAVEALIKPKKR